MIFWSFLIITFFCNVLFPFGGQLVFKFKNQFKGLLFLIPNCPKSTRLSRQTTVWTLMGVIRTGRHRGKFWQNGLVIVQIKSLDWMWQKCHAFTHLFAASLGLLRNLLYSRRLRCWLFLFCMRDEQFTDSSFMFTPTWY